MDIAVAGARSSEDVVSLWERAGLARPWNDPRADFARAAGGASSEVLVGSSDGDLVASVMVGHDGHRGWVYYLAVDPACQGRGFGRAMMEAAEMWLRQREIPKLDLMVRNGNKAVDAFYLALGYVLDDVHVFSRRLDVS